MSESELKDPVILSDAADEFSIDRRWLRKQTKKTKADGVTPLIRTVKVGHHVLVEREDVAKIAPQRRMLEKALANRRARREGQK